MQIIEHSNEFEKNNKKEKKLKINNKYLLFIGFLLIGFLVGIFGTYKFIGNNTKVITKNRVISNNKVTEEAIEEAIDKIYDAVLCIEVLDTAGNTKSTGTGFVYDKEGYVLTNAHVVSSGENIKATLANNNVVTLKLLGMDTYTDLAVLKMDSKEVVKVASLGTSQNTRIGNTVFTVGSPMGTEYAGTVTKGILSGKDRLIETTTSSTLTSQGESYIVKVIQTDAAISPGNSGGPLVNLAGDVIGINSLKLVDEEVEGMGFAIPIEDALTYVDYLEKGLEIRRPVLGVEILDLTNSYILYRYNVDIPSKVNYGVVLMNVTEAYPAEKAGLKKGDIITKINGNKVTTTSELKYQLYKNAVDSTIEVTYYRGNKELMTKVKLDKANN